MKKTAKKLLSVILCLTFILGVFATNIGSIQTEATGTQKAMFLFKNTLYITCNVENHAYKSNYPYRKPIDIIDNLSGNGNAYAPFDCKVVGKYEGTDNGNTVAFESLEKVQFADGTVDYMTFMVAHDNDISDISVGKTYSQGSVFYQEGTKGISTGAHIHLEVARGAYSKRSSSSQSIWAFVRGQYNAIYPNNAFYLYEGTKISNTGGYTWQIAKTTYTLTYDANGGYGAPPPQTDSYIWNISNTVPVRDGYTFLGWAESSTATTPTTYGGNAIFGMTSDMTLYAVWQPNHTHHYVLTDSYAATCTTDGYKEYTCSCDDKYTTITQYALGHDFSDYDIETAHPHYAIYRCSRSGCSEISRTSETNYNPSCSQCNPATYTVSYNANGGSGAPASQTKNHGSSLTLSSSVPTKKYTITYNANGGSVSPASKTLNCKFTNWNTSQNGKGTSYKAGATYSANSNVTLYAQYATPTAGTLATPTRSGYKFDGWYTAASGGTKITTSTVISKNTTVYAHWTKNAEPSTKPSTPTTKPTVPATKPSTPATKPNIVTTVTIRIPSTTSIAYGDSIILHADVKNLPSGAKVVWTADNSNFTFAASSDGTICTVSPSANGNTTFTATVVDANGKEISSDSQTMTSNAGIFQKIIAFFKKLFGMTKVIPEMIKTNF